MVLIAVRNLNGFTNKNMINGNRIEKYDEDSALTLLNILKKITDWDIFHFYIPGVKINGIFNSKLRKDKNPSASVKLSKLSGACYYTDYATGESMNSVQYVQGLYSCNFDQALQKINVDFGLGLGGSKVIKDFQKLVTSYEQPEKITSYRRIDVFTRRMTTEELAYWSKRFITEEELKKNYIFGIDRLYLDGQRITNPKHMLRFAYYFPKIQKWKIYTPYADKSKGEFKWISNLPIDVIECLWNIRPDKICVGTKSRKDRIILQKWIPETFSCQNESDVSISPDNINIITSNSEKCYLFFDNDEAGVKHCQYYNQFEMDYINIPKQLKVKDPDEFIVKYGPQALEAFLHNKKLI